MDKYRHRALHDLLKLTYFRIVAVLCTLYNNCIVFLFRLLEYYANIRIADLYEDSTPTDNQSTINIFSLITHKPFCAYTDFANKNHHYHHYQ